MKAGVWMALPAMLLLTVFVFLPFLLAAGLSLTNLRLGSPLPLEFVGLRQYFRVLGDPLYRQALGNTLVFALVVVPLQTALALLLALLLNRPGRYGGLLRALFFLPVVLPMALIAVIWVPLFAPGPDGMFNALMSGLSGGRWEPVDWLHHPFWSLPALILVSIWQGLGFQMVILLAGLQSIPPDLYEAASLDGAGPLQRLRFITLPQLRLPLTFTALTTTILCFRVFDQVQILTRGGPVGSTTTLVYRLVTTVLERSQVGQAAAATVLFFGLVLSVSLMQSALSRNSE